MMSRDHRNTRVLGENTEIPFTVHVQEKSKKEQSSSASGNVPIFPKDEVILIFLKCIVITFHNSLDTVVKG